MKDYAQTIRDNNNEITGDLLKDIITEHDKERERMISLYERYKTSHEGVPIFRRKHPDYDSLFTTVKNIERLDDKVNNTLNNSFDSDIADTAQGYFLGHPIMYSYEEEGKEAGLVDDFNLRNHVEDADSEWGKMAIICGKGARLAYVDKEGKERIKNIDPWQCIFLGDSIHEPEYSIRHYKDAEGTKHAEFYNDRYVYYFKDDNGKYVEDERVIREETASHKQEHLFDYNPLFGLANNKEQQGDAEKVLMLIDAYDRTLSDASNEIEQYRLAYLVFKGMAPDEDTNDQMRHQRIIELMEENDDVSYLTKDVNDDLIEHHLDRLEKNIMKFAKSVDFTDENFAGDSSGIALRYKLLSLENKCVTKERKMTASLRYQYKVLFSAWAKRHSINKDNYLKVQMTFQRNLPVNILEEAEIQEKLDGKVSNETRLRLFSKLNEEQVQAELQRMKTEEDEYMRNMPDVSDDEPRGN